MDDYFEDVCRFAPTASQEAVEVIVRYLGIALRNRDSSLVSCGDPSELERIRDGYCRKKLGLEQAVAEAAIKEVCRQMSGERHKNRVTFYYLIADRTGTLSKLG